MRTRLQKEASYMRKEAPEKKTVQEIKDNLKLYKLEKEIKKHKTKIKQIESKRLKIARKYY